MDDESIVWEVQEVLEKRDNPITGQLEYLLQWKNWDGEPTWEPAENCDCHDLIERYEKNLVSQLSDIKKSQATKKVVITPKRTLRGRGGLRSASRNTGQSSIDVIDIADDDDDDDDPDDDDDDDDDDLRKQSQPRSKSPPVQNCCDSSCSEAENDYENWEANIKERKLLLKEIVGAVNSDKDILLIVKWHGISGLEKVPLQVLRRFHSQDILDFFLEKIQWRAD